MRIDRLLIPLPLLLESRRRGDRVLGTLVDGTWNVRTTFTLVVLSPTFPIVHLTFLVLEVSVDRAGEVLIREPSFWRFSQSKRRRRKGSLFESNESL